jgi:hypothetical protein
VEIQDIPTRDDTTAVSKVNKPPTYVSVLFEVADPLGCILLGPPAEPV